MTRPTLSVIGLGLMGTAVARTFAEAGYPVCGWNRNARRASDLPAAVRMAVSFEDAVASGEIVFILTKSYKTTRPLLERVSCLAGKTMVPMMTGSPRDAVEFSEWVRERKGACLDVAIKRGPIDFGSDCGAMFFGGPRLTFDAIEPVLKTLGGRLVFLSENVGAAKAFDLATFARSYCWLFGYFQAVTIAREYGLDVEDATTQMMSVVSSTYRFIDKAAPEIAADIFAPAVSASVATHYSALSHAIEAVGAEGLHTPLLNVIRDYMERTIAAGLGDREIAACFRAVSGDRDHACPAG
jgi:3-hydroxyisobutyrate dehydrogenase-like beta-hydroxyacid dehydrogenase